MGDKFSKSEAHLRASHNVIPGGCHTYAKGDDQYPDGMAPIVARGDGCRVWDIDGNEFIEYGMGLRSVTLGHNYRPVLEAVTRHLEDGLNFVRPHRLERIAAERLVDLIPSADMVKFALNGSDVTSAAVRLARAYTGRDVIAICGDHPFFSTDDWFIGTTPMDAGVPRALQELTVKFRYNDLADLEAVLTENAVAAVIMEAETVEPPLPGYLDGVRRLCDNHGALWVLDEIITGFRWDVRGAQFVYDVAPDLCTFAKGIANGFPVAALAGRRDVMRLGGYVEDRDRVFLLSQTYGAQPWAMAAVLATIEAYEREEVTARLHQTGARIREGFDAAVSASGLSEHLQLLGRDCNLVYVTRDQAGERSQLFRTLLLRELLAKGVLAPSFVTSLAHDDRAVEVTLEALVASLPAYRRALDGDLPSGRPVRPAIRRRG
jgi:glutamate-1-semialdehyde 2,1-aminomutase